MSNKFPLGCKILMQSENRILPHHICATIVPVNISCLEATSVEFKTQRCKRPEENSLLCSNFQCCDVYQQELFQFSSSTAEGGGAVSELIIQFSLATKNNSIACKIRDLWGLPCWQFLWKFHTLIRKTLIYNPWLLRSSLSIYVWCLLKRQLYDHGIQSCSDSGILHLTLCPRQSFSVGASSSVQESAGLHLLGPPALE